MAACQYSRSRHLVIGNLIFVNVGGDWRGDGGGGGFWFVLSAFCSQMAGWQYSTDHASELPARAAEMLKAVCSFWRCLWPLRERFKHGNYPSQMPFWGGFAMGVGQLMGIPKDDILKIVHVAPEEAEQVMRGWLLMAGYA